MESKWKQIKEKAIALRKTGASLRDVEKQLGIPRSTLNGWFMKIILTDEQKELIRTRWLAVLAKSRVSSKPWHNNEKKKRLKEAEEKADLIISKLNFKDTNLIELALSMLYLGEGFKTNQTGIGNSNPLILKFFIKTLKEIYSIDTQNIKCDLHLRADQNDLEMKNFWSKELELPLSCFRKSCFDLRTKGSATYPDYKGVCVVTCSPVAIQRKLLYLSNKFCNFFINN